MALLMIGRLTSRQRWAGVVEGAGAAAATQLPIWHLGDPVLWLAFVLAGAVVDVGFAIVGTRALWAVALLGGIAHACMAPRSRRRRTSRSARSARSSAPR
jgi:hypothetical protein